MFRRRRRSLEEVPPEGVPEPEVDRLTLALASLEDGLAAIEQAGDLLAMERAERERAARRAEVPA